MARQLLEPDVGFIKELEGRGGDTLKKCFQCATCSVVCPIAPDNQPFPRKEMIAASWGLKDRLVSDVDVWLCHQCGDCSEKCPRGAKPGDVLGALRSMAIQRYAKIPALAQALNDPKKLPLLILAPAIIFLVVGFLSNLVGLNWLDFTPALSHGHISHGMFFNSWLVDVIFVPTFTFAIIMFALAIKDFITDMHDAAVREGKVSQTDLNWLELAKALPKVIVPILRHDKFNECGENKARGTSHMMVLFGFIGLFIVTGIFFVVLYGSMGVFTLQGWSGETGLWASFVEANKNAWHGPYPQWLPVKWLANIAGIALLVGGLAMARDRLTKDDSVAQSSYQDWFLIGLVLALAITGLGAQMTRLAGAATLTYFVYFLHLMSVWMLFAYVPFSKLAHLVYRTAAMTYAEYAGREIK